MTKSLVICLGTATVEGYDIRHDMSAIYGLMGVCPQHDLLWDQLTASEHLYFYGRLKNLQVRYQFMLYLAPSHTQSESLLPQISSPSPSPPSSSRGYWS